MASGHAATAGDQTHRVRASAGATSAEVVYVERASTYDTKPRIRISRRGTLLVTERIPVHPRGKGYGVVPMLGSGWFTVRDLDGDGEPEVTVTVGWGGAYCCSWSRIYRFDGQKFRVTTHWWGDFDASPTLRDLDADRRPELLSIDDRFAVLTAHVASFFPVQIWSFDRGKFRDVTRRYPRLVERDAARLWRYYVGNRRNGTARYVLAAWAADQCLLGRPGAAERGLANALRRGDLKPRIGGPPDPRAYLRRLRVLLRRWGYSS